MSSLIWGNLKTTTAKPNHIWIAELPELGGWGGRGWAKGVEEGQKVKLSVIK